MSKSKQKQSFLTAEKFQQGASEITSTIINTLKGLPFVGGLFDDLDHKIPEWISGINDSERITRVMRELQSLSAKRNATMSDINKMITSLENAGFSVSGKVKSAINQAKAKLHNRYNELSKHDLTAQTLTDQAINLANQGDTLSEGIRGKGIDTKISKIKENIYGIQEKFK